MNIPDFALSSRSAPHDRLLPLFLSAITLTAVVAWAMQYALHSSARFDLTGQVETLLPLARLGVMAAPIIVIVRGAVATVIAWLVAGALDQPVSLRVVAAGVLTWLPLLELPALADAIAVVLHPQRPFTAAHLPLGLDALWSGGSVRTRVLAQTVNLALITFTVLFVRHLAHRAGLGLKVALPAALASAGALVALPLLRV